MLLKNISKNLDKLGVGVSLLCAVHCAALPLIISSLPLLGLKIFGNPLIETSIILLSLIIGIISLSTSYVKHKNWIPMLIIVWGFALIFTGHFLISDTVEWIFLSIGGLTVATAHYCNRKLNK